MLLRANNIQLIAYKGLTFNNEFKFDTTLLSGNTFQSVIGGTNINFTITETANGIMLNIPDSETVFFEVKTYEFEVYYVNDNTNAKYPFISGKLKVENTLL